MGRSADYSKQRCAVAATLDIIGEPWTLLIIRDAFRGTARFEQWQEGLGLARNVLAARLKRLVAEGVFETRLYWERPKRYEYVLTQKGRELRPIIWHMMTWGRDHVYGDEAPIVELKHADCGQVLTPVVHCAECDGVVGPDAVEVHRNPCAKSLEELSVAHAAVAERA